MELSFTTKVFLLLAALYGGTFVFISTNIHHDAGEMRGVETAGKRPPKKNNLQYSIFLPEMVDRRDGFNQEEETPASARESPDESAFLREKGSEWSNRNRNNEDKSENELRTTKKHASESLVDRSNRNSNTVEQSEENKQTTNNHLDDETLKDPSNRNSNAEEESGETMVQEEEPLREPQHKPPYKPLDSSSDISLVVSDDPNTPAYAVPSEEELKATVQRLFGGWRTLADAAAPPPRAPAAAAPGAAGRGGCRPLVKRNAEGFTLFSEDELERCYEPQRQGYDFGPPLRQVEVVTMGPNPAPQVPERGVVAYLTTSRPDDLKALRASLANLRRAFLDRHPYPVAVFHEDFTPATMKQVAAQLGDERTLHFVKVEFLLPAWLERLSWLRPLTVMHFTGHPTAKPIKNHNVQTHGLIPYGKRGLDSPTKGFGYYHMCRFFAGAAFMLPFFDEYDWYWRLDTDNMCSGSIEDLFSTMVKKGKVYAYQNEGVDSGDYAEGMHNFVQDYMKKYSIEPQSLGKGKFQFPRHRYPNGQNVYPNCVGARVDLKATAKGVDPNSKQAILAHALSCETDMYKRVPYFHNNFEVVSIKFLRSKEYQHWFHTIDKTGNFFFHRWGDAPLRYMGVTMLLKPDQIFMQPKILCRHNHAWVN